MNFHGNARNHSTLSLAAPAEKRNPALKTLKPSNLHDILGPSVGFWYLDGVGFDIPWNSTLLPADPEKIYQSVLKSFEAGARRGRLPRVRGNAPAQPAGLRPRHPRVGRQVKETPNPALDPFGSLTARLRCPSAKRRGNLPGVEFRPPTQD